MKRLQLVTAGGLAFVVIGCALKPQDLILGKWQGVSKAGGPELTVTVDFAKDGTVKTVAKVSAGEVPMTARYRFVDDHNIELEFTGPTGQVARERNKIESISRDRLVLSDSQGKKLELKRIP
jgi:hypothetical protein